MEQLDERYKKRNIALMIIETQGFTVDEPDDVSSRSVFSGAYLDQEQSERIHAVYPALV
jgi:hypothetical protein